MSPPFTHDPSHLQHNEGTKMFRVFFRLRRLITNAADGIPGCVHASLCGTAGRGIYAKDNRTGAIGQQRDGDIFDQ